MGKEKNRPLEFYIKVNKDTPLEIALTYIEVSWDFGRKVTSTGLGMSLIDQKCSNFNQQKFSMSDFLTLFSDFHFFISSPALVSKIVVSDKGEHASQYECPNSE